MELKYVDIGREIKLKFERSRMTKTLFAKKLNIPSQNVNRIFEKDSIETSKLLAISNALNFNFFSLYSDDKDKSVSTQGDFSPINKDGDLTYMVGDAVLAEKVKSLEAINAEKDERIKELKERIEELKSK